MPNLVVEELKQTPMEEHRVELVERKGKARRGGDVPDGARHATSKDPDGLFCQKRSLNYR